MRRIVFSAEGCGHEETPDMAIYVGGGPPLMYVAEAVLAYKQFTAKPEVIKA